MTSAANGVPLCDPCHFAFDRTEDPGFVFLPTDLQYFIDYELRDRERRQRAIDNGGHLCRQVPTSEEYRIHQVTDEEISLSADAPGGLYKRYFLSDYLLGGALPPDTKSSLSSPKPWHGSPIGTLRRGFLVLGGARVRALSPQTRSQLARLRDLYFLADEENWPDVENSDSKIPVTEERKRRSDDEQGRWGKRVKEQQSGPGEGSAEAEKDKSNAYGQCSLHARSSPVWVLGPHVSTEEVVRRYAPAISSSECW